MQTYDKYKEIVEANLLNYLPDAGKYASKLRESMAYSLSIGGKRLRPVLLLSACDAAGGDLERALPYACALEYIHTYSLIHDDLPAMDDDDMRRGKPSNHKVFGEAMAILAGDGLLNTAAELISEQALNMKGDAESLYAHARAAHEILNRSGASGMIAGQTADVLSEDKEATADLVEYIELHKTADLITAPVRAGLMLANAEESMIDDFTVYARNLGVSFQIADDILDYEGSEELMGKTLGKDSDQNKCNYASVHGMQAAKNELHRLTKEAKSAIEKYSSSDYFNQLADMLEERQQ